MDVEGAVQMGLTAALGMVLLYTITRTGNGETTTATTASTKTEVKYSAPPATEQRAVPETPVKKYEDKTQNESAIARELQVPPETPSWVSQKDPSFVREFQEEDLHPTWMAGRKDPTPIAARHKENGTQHNNLTVHKEEEFTPSWLSHREPSFNGIEEVGIQPTWMSKTDPTPIHHVASTNGHSVHSPRSASSSSAMPATEKKVNQAFVEEDHIEQSWLSSREVQVEEVDGHDFSWMTRKNPTPTVRAKVSTKAPAHLKENRVVHSTNEIVSHFARDHSDIVFVYPVAAAGYLGETLQHEQKHHPKCQVQLVETRAGAGRVVVGSASSAKKRVSVLASSRSLRPMIPAVSELAERSLPVTFHIACSTLSDEDVSSKTDHSDLSAIRDIPNVTILVSSSAQDSYETAVAAHWIADRLSSPVFHVFDAAGRLNRVSDIELTLRNKENYHFHPHNHEHNTPAKIAAALLRSVRKGPFEYTGSAHARVVIVAMGAAAQEAERHVHEHSSTNIGCVRVRMLRPWSAEELVKCIPNSALRICVLDQSQTDGLFADVAASFASDPSRRHVQVSYVHVPPSFRGVTFDLIGRAFDELHLSNDERIVLSSNHGASKANGRHQKDGHHDAEHVSKTVAVFIRSKHAHCAFKAGREAIAHMARDKVRLACYTDDFASEHGGISLLELRFADAHSHAVHSFDSPLEAGQAQVVVIGDEDCLNAQQVDLFGPLQEGGTVILPHGSHLSLALKRRASAKQARIIHLSKHAGPEGWSAITAALEVLSKHDAEHVLSYILNAFRASHHDSMDWNDLNEACRRLEHGLESHSSLAENGGDGSHARSSNGHHFPRRLGDLFQSNSQSDISFFNSNGMDASQNGISEFSTNSFPLSESTVFGLIPRVAFSRQSRQSKALEQPVSESQLEIVRPHEIAWNVVFKDAYETDAALRPREHATYKVRLVCRKRLTPLEYDRNIFHLEFDISGTDLKYEIGDALGVFGHNDAHEVDDFIHRYNATGGAIDPESFIAFKNTEKHQGKSELVSVRNLFLQHLDLFGRPSKKFYVWLAAHAKSRYEHLKLLHTGTDDAEGFKLGVNETLTFADILLQHPSARPSVEQLASVIPPIKARHYSIASSMRYCPRSVSLLIVQVDWKTPMGRKRYGQCTRYLANLDVDAEEGCFVTVDVVPSVLRLPPRPDQPIVMAGLGTGMAPFRAFVQERKVQKESGLKVGPIVLYFGARHRSEEWLYGDEWDQYFKEGLVTRLGLAFSRDQKEKIYIQHRIKEDAHLLKDLFIKQEGYFYLCGPTWPVPDVRDAVAMGLDPENAKNGNTDIVEKLKDEGRYILEVY